jgi:hypothetical protein
MSLTTDSKLEKKTGLTFFYYFLLLVFNRLLALEEGLEPSVPIRVVLKQSADLLLILNFTIVIGLI